MARIWSSQPLKALYTIFFLLATPPYAAALFLRYLAKPSHPDWTARMSLSSDMLKLFFRYSLTTQSRRILDDDPATAKERLAIIEPPARSLFSGALAPTASVKPGPVRGVWLPDAPSLQSPNLEDEKVVIHFPGGAFVITFGHEGSGRPVSEVLTKHLKASKVLWAQYRLAADEQTCFPAAVQDALTYYNYVLSLASEIDADGSLRTNTPGFPVPGGAVVWSPWVEVTPNAGKDYEGYANAKSDMLDADFLQWGAESYLGKNGGEKDNLPYTSPLSYPFKTSVPLYIHAGAAEGFCQSITKFAANMRGVDGNRVAFCATPKAPHDLLLGHPTFGMTDELHTVLDVVHEFLNGER
ncbi:hypothetical protein INS49_004786 [Diaporthe citri]|uniref:uncharacterized protein n=1 Tax=Diaporthe citri TaxID=83186 RepID=UPI001C80A474|nr:uncharacterized protein INS49_004786 [Diaporthe citri]KAG6354182.1 hypothetical protein INS49_004786 [Diaporthe citri]